MRRSIITILAIFMVAGPTFGLVRDGDPAPTMNLESIISDKPTSPASLKALKGKAIVIEFWATWCAPCVEAIPHFNELVKRFEGRPIRFISVTSEDRAVVIPFLKSRPIAGWIGFDPGDNLFNQYGFEARPSTVLIDRRGKVVGITHPATLTEKHLEDVLAGRVPDLPPVGRPDMNPRSSLEAEQASMLDIIIRPASGTSSGMQMAAGKYRWMGTTVRELFSAAYSIPSSFVEVDGFVDTARYDVSAIGPSNENEALQRVLPDLLQIAFHVSMRREVREIDGWILTAPSGKPQGLVEAAGSGGMSQAGGGILKITGMGMGQLASMMQRVLKKPVVDKTGIEGRFDVAFHYDQDQPETLLEAMRERGFDFKPAKLPTEFLIVMNKEK